MPKVHDKTKESRITPYNAIMTTHPMELVHMDYMKTESGRFDGKGINVLAVTDHFTCYAQVFVTPSQAAKVVTEILWDKYFVHYGLPEKIISDQGKNFESSLIEGLVLSRLS